jgi:hypothetical protein
MAQRIVDGEQYEAFLVRGGLDGEPLPFVTGLEIPSHDHIALGYNNGDLTSVTYKVGGASGTTVGVLTLTYHSSGALATVTKS